MEQELRTTRALAKEAEYTEPLCAGHYLNFSETQMQATQPLRSSRISSFGP